MTTRPAPPTTHILSSFRLRDFRFLWLASLGFSGGMWVQQVAVGWLVLQMTDSPVALGATQAARMLPSLLFGLTSGVVADRFERRSLLAYVGALSAVSSAGLALLASAGRLELWHVLLLTFVFGSCRAFEWPAAQALIYDLVGPEEALKGVSLNATASRLMGVVSGFAGGALIPAFGPQGALLMMAAGYGIGTVLVLCMRPRPATARQVAARPPFWQTLRGTYQLARSNPRVLGVFLLTCCGEVFAFSHQTVVPLFARDVLRVGPEGLGALTSARALGSVVSSLVLARLAYVPDKMRLLLAHYALYGLGLAAFAASSSFALSLVLMTAIGIAASSLDILQQTLLQLSVGDTERGRAVGFWVVALGFGPLGHMEIGALGALAGPAVALAANATVLLGVFVVAGLIARHHGAVDWMTRAPARPEG